MGEIRSVNLKTDDAWLRWHGVKAIFAAAVLVSGCSHDAPLPAAKQPSAAPAAVRLLVVEDPALVNAVQGMAGDWKAESGSSLKVSTISADATSSADKLEADAIIYPPELLGTLAERRLIRPLNRAWLTNDPLEAADLLAPLDAPELTWDGQPFAVPLGEPILLLFYRPDVLERLGKPVPQTWEEYQTLATELSRRPNLRATAEPLADGWAARMLLARAAAYARHRDYLCVLFNRDTLEPLIAGPPFVRALDELVKTAKLSPAGGAELTPPQCVDLVLSGQAAMAIGFLDRHGKEAPGVSLAVAELPGSDIAYHLGHAAWEPRRSGEPIQVTLRGIGGRIGSIVRGSDHAETAFTLLAWLASKRGSQQLMSADVGFAPFRISQFAISPQGIGDTSNQAAAKQSADRLSAALRRHEALWLPRIPGAIEYMAALDQAVRAAVGGEKTSQQALDEAAKQWKEITTRHGAEQQLEAYRRSLKSSP
jgi:ABC-type glycerol-3-phosphate transport system substrate-binding protein